MATFTDNFTRADGAVGDNYFANLSISSNSILLPAATSIVSALVGWRATSADYDVQFTNTPDGFGGGPAVRMLDVLNLYFTYLGSDGVFHIYKRVAGGFTELASAGGFTPPLVQKISISGTTIKGYLGGVERLSTTDSAFSAKGFAGWYVDSNGAATIDDFSATNHALPSGVTRARVIGGV